MRRKLTTIALGLALACAACGCAAGPGGYGGAGEGAGQPLVQSVARTVLAKLEAPAADAGNAPAEPYAYSQLDDADRERYRILLEAFRSREARPYPDDDMDRLTRIRDCVLADHPELFAVESVHMETTSDVLTGAVTAVKVEGRYASSAEEAAGVLERAGQAAAECFAQLPADASDYEKAKRAYEFLVERVEYVHDDDGTRPSPDQTIEGALVNGRAVCGGYANAYAYLLQGAGIPCSTVTGIGDGVDHAWCLASLDGDYYFIDPTWGDPVGGSLNYDYLAITSDDLEKQHRATSPFPLPRCTATADNYYVHEGLVLYWADETGLAQHIAAGFNQIRCADAETYAALLDFVTSGRLANVLDVERYSYSSSDELLTLKVYPA